jgi:hypothetical protein
MLALNGNQTILKTLVLEDEYTQKVKVLPI